MSRRKGLFSGFECICISAFVFLMLSRSVLNFKNWFKVKSWILGDIPALSQLLGLFLFFRAERKRKGKKEENTQIHSFTNCGLGVRPRCTFVVLCGLVSKTHCHFSVKHPYKANSFPITICSISIPSVDFTNPDTRKGKKEKHNFNHFIPSFEPSDSALTPATSITPFHLNRSFTRCCAINDWLSLHKSEGKTPALLVLQCKRLCGVQYYSNHSVEVSRALSGMFRDSHHPASFTEFTVLCGRRQYSQIHRFYTNEEVSSSSDTKSVRLCIDDVWGFALRKCVVAEFTAQLYEKERLRALREIVPSCCCPFSLLIVYIIMTVCCIRIWLEF